ncbi:MAG: BON domain-containing protein [Isosphaeraceae bacterium]|nr:BON domain-containing protein [Isosphaeraceae bacterium]
MKFTYQSMFGAACVLTMAAGALRAEDEPVRGTHETVGNKLDSGVQSLKRGAKEAGETIQQQFERARTSVHNMGVSGRVYGRLHWDKDLQGAKINLDVQENGVATLTGTVPDAKAKVKAVTLTQDTVGVVKVVDRTTIQAADADAPGTVTTKEVKTETKVETTKP